MSQHQALVILPEGWVEIPDATEFLLSNGVEGVQSIIDQQTWSQLDPLLEGAGYLPAGKEVRGAQMMGTGNLEFKLFVLFGDVPV